MADEQSRAERDGAWQAAWRGEDFSWEGLAQKPWKGWSVLPDGRVVETASLHGGPPIRAGADRPSEEKIGQARFLGPRSETRAATLQDYWRDEEAHLIEGDGKRWTRAHLPMVWSNGTPTGKAGWDTAQRDALAALVSAKLIAAAESSFESVRDGGPDRRAQYHGAVLLGAPAHPRGLDAPLSARFERAAFAEAAVFSGATFAPYADFEGALFCADADFSQAAFERDAGFEGAAFLAGAKFVRARFGAHASFDNATFVGVAVFADATFSDEARFYKAAFCNLARFVSTTFAGGALFNGARFVKDAGFLNAVFSQDTAFRRAEFSEQAKFFRARFAGDASFDEARFSGEADFEQADFRRDASFEHAIFAANARFLGGGNGERASFRFARFEAEFACSRREFAGLVYFDRAHFESDLDFHATVFAKPVSCDVMSWPKAPQDWHRAFDEALFASAVSFTGSGFKAFAAFDGAILERGVKLDDPGERKATQVFEDELRGALEAARADAAAWAEAEEKRRKEADAKARPVARREIAEREADFRERRLQELERGCRVLKQAMAEASHKAREQLLYRFELRARRMQAGTPGWEKLFSDLYGAASDYGASMARPFAALAVVIAAFGAIFWIWAFTLGRAEPGEISSYAQALDLSMSNVFRPLSALTEESTRDNELAHDLVTWGDWTALGVRALASLESLLALLLAFLFALAVRRRFQID